MKKQKIVPLVIAVVTTYIVGWLLMLAGIPPESQKFLIAAVLLIIFCYDLIKLVVEDS